MTSHPSPFRGDFQPPPNLRVKQVKDVQELLLEISKRSLLGYSGIALFGNAFLQGGRLQFTSALPISQLMDIAYVHQAMKPSAEDAARGTVGHLASHANRPRIAAHSNRLRHYLLETACVGEPFFLPSFTLNFGAYVDRDLDAEAELIVVAFASGGGSAVCFPAILFLPSQIRLPVTDGGHRVGQLDDLLAGKLPGEQKEALRRNSVDIKIVFEGDLAQAHQDFADAGKAQPIAKSVIATYDLRDERNRIAKELSTSIPFLPQYPNASWLDTTTCRSQSARPATNSPSRASRSARRAVALSAYDAAFGGSSSARSAATASPASASSRGSSQKCGSALPSSSRRPTTSVTSSTRPSAFCATASSTAGWRPCSTTTRSARARATVRANVGSMSCGSTPGSVRPVTSTCSPPTRSETQTKG